MVKTSVIRGRPNYVYRGHNYIEQPEKTLVKKMVYNQETNVTNVYCKRPSIVLEIICMLVVIACVVANISYIHDSKVAVKYNSIATYFNDKLYLNLMSDENNNCNVKYILYDGNTEVAEGILEPGELIVSIPISNVKDSYNLELQYSSLTEIKSQIVTINVTDRSQ